MKKSTCAISTGPYTHLDHLVPLCDILDVPLLVTEPDFKEIAQKFYPMVEVKYVPLEDLHLKALSDWDILITTCKFWTPELGPTLELLQGKKIRFIYIPHGHSDKEEFLKKPVEQDIELVYGPAMKKVRCNPHAIEIGNIRYNFYLEHKAHFDRLAAPFFHTDKQTILYAPTWASRASSTSFFESIDFVVEQLSKTYNLLVKPHPFLEENHPALYYFALDRYKTKATFIEEFPIIYPLLEKTDIYLGDHSSIGYDFLIYDRPMYFLKEGQSLAKCGKPFSSFCSDSQKNLSETRKNLVKEVFKAPPLKGAELKKAIDLFISNS